MTEPTTAQLLFDDVAADLRAEAVAIPMKCLSRSTRLAGSMVKRAREGKPPGRTVNFLWTLKRIGPVKARRALRSVIGPADVTDALADLGRTMEAAHHDFAKVLALLPAGALDRLADRALPRALREVGEAGGEAAAGRRALSASAAAGDGRVHAVPGAAVAVRRGLDIVAGDEGHIGRHFRLWRDRCGRAARLDLAADVQSGPAHRTSVVTDHRPALVFDAISPAFRLYSESERARLIGRPTTDVPDRDYAEACAANTRQVIESGEPALDDVDATVMIEPGFWMRLSYRRLVLPYVDGMKRFAVCASEPIGAVA